MGVKVRSFAKVNLGLAVGAVREDGFHGLATVYQTVGLHDFVTVEAREAGETKIVLTADHAGVPRTEAGNAEKNTAFVMVAKALQRMGLRAEVRIGIEKRLPVQGGMGAGSANAVAALLGLERELGKALPGAERLELAAEVGSDVPLFLIGGTVLGLGRGEEVYPLPDLPGMECVVAVPKVGVSTRLAFEALDKRQGVGSAPQGLKPSSVVGGIGTAEAVPLRGTLLPGAVGAGEDPCLRSETWGTQSGGASLTFAQGDGRLRELSRVLAAVWCLDGVGTGLSGITRPGQFRGQRGDLAENPLLALVRTGIENDFEEVAFSQHPSLRSTKRDLVGSDPGGAVFACLSGSGSALFGLYASQADARAAQQRVLASGTEALLTETLTREAYWDTMFAE